MEKVITGDWNGQPIWREKTAEDRLRKIISNEHIDPVFTRAQRESEATNIPVDRLRDFDNDTL